MLWTYETVSEATGIASKYWDAEAPSERGTKTLAKEKLIATKDANYYNQGGDNSDGEISTCSSIDENPNDCTVIPTTSSTVMTSRRKAVAKSPSKKRKAKALTSESLETSPRKIKRVLTSKSKSCVGYTVASVLTTWDDNSEYGVTFRNLQKEEQEVEVKRLNVISSKGQKDSIKKKVLQVKYKTMLEDKMRTHLGESRSLPSEVYHYAPTVRASHIMNPSFISVGEWVEVDGDISPGWNSEGGIGIIIKVQDSLVDVKYVLTKWVEKLIPLRRLTTIAMPHRGPRASLRQPISNVVEEIEEKKRNTVSKFSAMSDVQILKYGLAEGLWKKKGWLYQLLEKEGLADGSRQKRKELCWRFYKSQMLYIEAIQDAKEDSNFDPRRSDHKTGKDGKFVAVKKGTVKPKNALTVTYLCFAFDVPYATFKRWKIDAGITTKSDPVNKGKSVISDNNWASKIYNVRRMYIRNQMALWLQEHPAQKYDTTAKKVMFFERYCCRASLQIYLLIDSLCFLGAKKILNGEMEYSYSRGKNAI